MHHRMINDNLQPIHWKYSKTTIIIKWDFRFWLLKRITRIKKKKKKREKRYQFIALNVYLEVNESCILCSLLVSNENDNWTLIYVSGNLCGSLMSTRTSSSNMPELFTIHEFIQDD